MFIWNRRDSTPLSAVPRAPKDDQGWIFWSYKSLSGLPELGPYRIFVLVFNWNHFEMRLLNLRINFYLLYLFLYLFIYSCLYKTFSMKEILIHGRLQKSYRKFFVEKDKKFCQDGTAR